MQNDIKIILKFDQKRFPAELLAYSLHLANDAVYFSELTELEQIQSSLATIPAVSFDAARYQLNLYRGHALLIEEASQGSIILGGVIGALAIWLLQQTIGQAIKEAWQETELHNRIKELLLKGKKEKASSIAHNFQYYAERDGFLKSKGVEIKVELQDNDTDTIIFIFISGSKQQTPPSRGEINVK